MGTLAPPEVTHERPGSFRPWRLVQRNILVYRHTLMVLVSGFFEPLFYLLAIGFGIGTIVGDLEFGGRKIAFAAFVAPAMLATSCMNGALTEGFFNPFFRLHYQRTYDAVLATPMTIKDIAIGELIWAVIRGSLYCVGFLVVILAMGLVLSPWALLALPAAIFVAASFSSAALMLMTFARNIDDFDKVMNLVIYPLFLFSGTFFPLSVYPPFLQVAAHLSPLYHGASLLRGLTTGTIGMGLLFNLAFLGALMIVSMKVATKRLNGLLIK